MLPRPAYRHALELGCSVGVLTEALAARCDHVTATDIAQAALCETDGRLRAAGRRQHVTLQRTSIDCAWPADDFDLVMLSEVAYYLSAKTLRQVMDREVPNLMPGTTLLAAHWRHPVSDTPSTATEPTTSSARRPRCTKPPTIETATSSSTCLRTRHRSRWPSARAYPEPTHKPTNPVCRPRTTPFATLSTRPLENKRRALTATSAPVPAHRPRSADHPARSRHRHYRSAHRPLCRRPRTRR